MELAAPGSRRATLVRHASPQRASGPMTPMAPTIPSSRNTGTAIATELEITSPEDRATPLVTTSASSARNLARSGTAPGGGSWAITSSSTSSGAKASRALPRAPLPSGRLVDGAIVTRSAWLETGDDRRKGDEAQEQR